jgi:hypothetical protein
LFAAPRRKVSWVSLNVLSYTICQMLSCHVEKYFTICLRPEHLDFNPVYVSAMFLDPYFSQLLTGRKEELALDFLKTKSSHGDVDSSGSSTISGHATS